MKYEHSSLLPAIGGASIDAIARKLLVIIIRCFCCICFCNTSGDPVGAEDSFLNYIKINI